MNITQQVDSLTSGSRESHSHELFQFARARELRVLIVCSTRALACLLARLTYLHQWRKQQSRAAVVARASGLLVARPPISARPLNGQQHAVARE